MSSRSALRQPAAEPQKDLVETPIVDVPPDVRADAAANDDAAAPRFSVFSDPLLAMAMASAVLLALLAGLIASS